MSDRTPLPGKFVWYEHVSREAERAQAFYAEVLGWKTQPFSLGDESYTMIYAGDTMIGGYAAAKGEDEAARWLACVSVEDVDAAAAAARANGGTVIEAPSETEGVGRVALIADREGAELYLFTGVGGDAPDRTPRAGEFFWNELHTTDPKSALAFYAEVVGFTHRALDMGPAGTYYTVGRDGVDRGGVTDHLPPYLRPHWLPYVFVEDVDATIARAEKNGARIPMASEDIPGVGRFGVFRDPIGALLSVMKPLPRG